jgi:hypothetical protein
LSQVCGASPALGNKVSSLFVELPVAEADPLRRYELVPATAEERKAGGLRASPPRFAHPRHASRIPATLRASPPQWLRVP